MSIGIAFTLEDRVLLVADSRSVKGFDQTDESISDDAEKIYEISPQIAAVGVGIEQGVRIAVDLLKITVNETLTLKKISEFVEGSLEAGWRGLKQIVASDADITAPYFKIGLLLGGVAEGQLFVMAQIRSHKSKTPLYIGIDSYDAIMIGMESLEISDRFYAKADEIAHKQSKDKNNEVLTEKILSLAKDTIGEIAESNKLIGEKSVHTIIWK